MPRLLLWPVLALAALMIALPASAQKAPDRIVAIGDLHGDFDAWRAIIQAAGLVDARGKWSGGSATLVQVGDVVDRGPDSLKIIRDLQRLQREAPKRGGQVVALVGNHEAMMMIGDLRYVHPGEYAAFTDRDSKARRDRAYEANKVAIEAGFRLRNPSMSPEAIRDAWMKSTPLGMLEHQAAWQPGGELGRWIIGNPAVLKLGDSLFVHGGISATYSAVPLDDINRRVAEALKKREQAVTAVINDPRGPLWYRGLIVRGGDDQTTQPPVDPKSGFPLPIEQEISLALNAFQVKRIVVGHTPVKGGIVEGAGGKLWRIDSAISQAYGGTPSYLEIVGDKVTPHKVPRPQGKQWGSQ